MSVSGNDNARWQPGKDTANGNQQSASCHCLMHAANPEETKHKSRRNRWQYYEMLKAQYTATALTPGQYAQACRRAAEEAGV